MIFAAVAALLAQFATATVPQDCKDVNSFLIFDPPSLTYKVSDAGASFKVRLANPPANNGTVSAGLFLDGMQFSQNKLEFDSTNWNKPQTVVISANAAWIDSPAVQLDMTVSINSPCMKEHKCTTKYPVHHDCKQPKTCSGSGDPHFTALDGTTYDFQGAGGFYYYKSPSLHVQGYQYPCSHKDKVTCVGAVSVRYGDSVVLIDGLSADDEHTKKSGGAKIKLVSDTFEGLDYSPKNVDSSTTFTFTTDCGATVIVNWNELPWMSATINLPPSYDGIGSGICVGLGKDPLKELAVEASENHLNGKYTKGIMKMPFDALWGDSKPTKLVPGYVYTDKDYSTVCQTATPPPPVTTTCAKPPPYTPPSVNPVPPTPYIPSPPTTTTSVPPAGNVPSTTTTTTTTKTTTTTTSTTTTSTTTTSTTSTTSTTTSTTSTTTSTPTTTTSTTSTTTSTTSTTTSTTTTSTTTTTTQPAAVVPTTSAVPPAATTTPGNTYTPPPVIVYTPQDIQAAETACDNVLSAAGCDVLAYSTVKFTKDSCVMDALLIGGHNFTQGYLNDLHAQCSHVCHSIINAPIQNTTAAQVATTIIVSNGYGNNTCPGNCSGNGVCGSTGCVCNSGFVGTSCATPVANLPCPVTPPTVQYSDGTTSQGSFAQLQPAANIPAANLYSPNPTSPAGNVSAIPAANKPTGNANLQQYSGSISRYAFGFVFGLVAFV